MAKQVAQKTISDDDKVLAMLAHLLGLFTGFIGPLVIYLVKSESPGFVKENARNALNFQISVIIYFIICFILMLVIIGIPMMVALGIFSLIVEILGSVRAYGGQVYKYPLAIPFLGSGEKV